MTGIARHNRGRKPQGDDEMKTATREIVIEILGEYPYFARLADGLYGQSFEGPDYLAVPDADVVIKAVGQGLLSGDAVGGNTRFIGLNWRIVSLDGKKVNWVLSEQKASEYFSYLSREMKAASKRVGTVYGPLPGDFARRQGFASGSELNAFLAAPSTKKLSNLNRRWGLFVAVKGE